MKAKSIPVPLAWDVVMHKPISGDEIVVMWCNREHYAVCRVHPRSQIATSPNYHVESGIGLLSAALSEEGLQDLVHWTDRAAALARFTALSNDEGLAAPRDGPDEGG